jgi:hypothetical protein
MRFSRRRKFVLTSIVTYFALKMEMMFVRNICTNETTHCYNSEDTMEDLSRPSVLDNLEVTL